MKEKLRILMQNENLTASRLADILGIKPAGISHILSGRNNPSYELVCKLINRFPQINPYWLLGDSDKMYNDTANAIDRPTTNSATQQSSDLFDFAAIQDGNHHDVPSDEIASTQISDNSPLVAQIQSTQSMSSDIERIIIAYKNGTFESYTPKK